MKYVLLFCDTEQSEKVWEAMNDAERTRAFEQVDRWFAEHAGKITHSARLQSPRTASTVRLEAGSDPIVTDGPFVEGKEVISGYVEIEVADFDEALRMVRTWPACPTVEIRPLL
ncbi:MAG: hypothetical protein IT305_31380 [Chloroflexi bacterium]|nr:hypothetical protein [Chloroflexota bacterium]